MIGKRLQDLRLERHMSLSELAKRASVAKSYLSAIERHIQVNPSLHVLAKLATVLQVPIQILLSETDTPVSECREFHSLGGDMDSPSQKK